MDDSRGAARALGRRGRIRALVRGVARSWWGRAGAVLVVLAISLSVTLPAQQSGAVSVVDIGHTAAQARQIAPYEVWVPTGLDAGWRATHASVARLSRDRVEVHFDFVAPDGGYVGVAQENADTDEFIRRSTASASVLGKQRIGHDTWTRMGDGRDAERIALVIHRDDGVVVVVAGRTTWPLLTQLAASLRPASG